MLIGGNRMESSPIQYHGGIPYESAITDHNYALIKSMLPASDQVQSNYDTLWDFYREFLEEPIKASNKQYTMAWWT